MPIYRIRVTETSVHQLQVEAADKAAALEAAHDAANGLETMWSERLVNRMVERLDEETGSWEWE